MWTYEVMVVHAAETKLEWEKKFKEEVLAGGTVKRLAVCRLCGSATMWSDALFHITSYLSVTYTYVYSLISIF